MKTQDIQLHSSLLAQITINLKYFNRVKAEELYLKFWYALSGKLIKKKPEN